MELISIEKDPMDFFFWMKVVFLGGEQKIGKVGRSFDLDLDRIVAKKSGKQN